MPSPPRHTTEDVGYNPNTTWGHTSTPKEKEYTGIFEPGDSLAIGIDEAHYLHAYLGLRGGDEDDAIHYRTALTENRVVWEEETIDGNWELVKAGYLTQRLSLIIAALRGIIGKEL